jgi:hypothetical protein
MVGLHGKINASGACEAIMQTIQHRTPVVGKPPKRTLQATFPEVFKRAAALEPGGFFPLGQHEIRELLLWKAGGDFRHGRQEVNAEFARLDCVFTLDGEEGHYGVRKKGMKAAPVPTPPPAPHPLVGETSVPTAEHLVELIAAGDLAKEEIVEACRLWVKLRRSKR